jgi:hypothetical protein
VDANLVQEAAAYAKAYPENDLVDWLNRLVRLGDLFTYSNQTERYRHELWAACRRLRPKPLNGAEWALVLAWAARLYGYYRRERRRARQISDVSNVKLPPRPKPYQPPPPEEVRPPEIEDEIVAEPRQEAKDLFARLQEKWAEQDDE